jgi:hypothetical protein
MNAINLRRYPLERFSIRPLHSQEFKNFFRDLKLVTPHRPPLEKGGWGDVKAIF